MRKFYVLILTVLISAGIGNAQNVSVSGAVSGDGTYADLGSAFTALNAASQTGASISISITGNTTEAASAVLNAGTWTSITISPSGARTISGSLAAPLIDLNGADNVTINGLNSGGNSLVIVNNSNSNITNTSTIRFIGDASSNTITNCTIQGGSTSLTLGTIYFATGVATGNDNNTISNCAIQGAGANLPTNGIYSSGTLSFENSGNTITGCEISDYFSATIISVGVLISSNNSDWTISNNKLFQTASRTYTTANTHRGIQISSGNNHVISGNTIGYATAAGTGTYTMTSTVATRFIAIDLAVGTTTASSVQGNTFTAFSLATSSGAATTNGIICGINITAGNVNVGNVSGNTIGAASGTGSISAVPTTTQGSVVGINSSSTGTILIQNNTIGSMQSSGTTASVAGGVFGINVSGAATLMTITGNTIGNSTTDNMRGGTSGLTTGSSIAAGINASSSPTTFVVTNNTIQNLTTYGTGTGGYVRGFVTATSGSSATTLTGNTIKNLTTTGALTGYSSGLVSACGIHLASGTNALISQNTIFAIANANAVATTNIVAAGISIAQATSTTVTRNRVYDIRNAGVGVTATGPPVAAGIIIRSGTSSANVNNNMISLGNGQTTNTSFIGIMANHGSTPDPVDNIYFNTVNIEGTAASGALSSFCFVRGDLSATARTVTVDIRDNIFVNSRSGGTGSHYAIANNFGATASATGWAANASNFNLLNAASGTVGYWTSAQNFAGWQTASASDLNSISGSSVSLTNTATGDLHISSFPTPIEGTGTPIGSVTVDYDNDNRAGNSPTDIGADAGNFLNSPVIVVTALPNVCTAASINLTANITDPDGVPVSGAGLPVLYYKINSGSYTAVTSTSLGSGQYQFSFTPATVPGDVVSYYIAAQDNLLNVGTSPALGASGFSANPPAAATPPTSPLTYSHLSTLGGTYTVGVGGDYTTLTAAVAAYNTACLSGPVVFNLIDATYPSETFPISINANAQASAVNTLTIRPTVNSTISGSSTGAIILLNGADYVTINGSINSTVNSVCPAVAATRNLTITNTSAATSSAVVWMGVSSTNDPVTNCSVQNCIVIGNAPTTTILGIGAGATSIGSGGGSNDNLSIINNDVRAVRVGIYVSGAGAATKNQNLIINQNTMTAAAPNNIGETGIYGAFVNNVTCSGNVIDNIIKTGSPDGVGINFGFGAVSGFSTTSTGIADGVTNVSITNNIIGAIENSGTFSSAGIGIGNTISGTSLIANNMIYGVKANGTAGDFAGGIVLGGGAGLVNVYNNTVSMQGTIPGATAASQVSACLAVTAAVSNLDIKNNIFSNTQVGNSSATVRFNAIALTSAAPYTNFLSNNNDLYVSGAGPGTYAVGQTGGLTAGTMRNTLSDWSTETGTDAASKNVAPVFVSATDLHLSTALGTNWCLNGQGTSLASVTNDIDCQSRNNPRDIGADEFVATSDDAATPLTQTVCSGSPITTIAVTGSATTLAWTRDNTGSVTGIAASGTGSISGTLTNTTNAPVTVTFTIVPTNGACTFTPIVATVTVNPTPNAVATPASQTICSGAAISTIAITGDVSGTTYDWTRDNTGSVTGIAASGSGDISGSLTNTTNAPVTVTFTITPSANGCSGTPVTATVTVNPTPDAVATPSSQTVCSGTAITTIVLNGGVAGTTYNWTRNQPSVTGIASSGSGDISGTLTNTTSSPLTVTFTITPSANGCDGTPITATITVNPAVDAVATPASQTICDGPITTIAITGSTPGTTFNWTRDNTATVTGIAASGSGDISGSLTNTTASPITVTFTITPSANGCSGTPVTATVLVNPGTSAVATPASQSVCSGDAITTIVLNGGVAGTTYNWTRDQPGITGIAASGSGDISGTFTNSGTSDVLVTFTITPTTGSCTGAAITASVLVKAKPSVSIVLTQPNNCNSNNGGAALTITGAPGPYTFFWVGAGIIQGQQDQSTLRVGAYSVTVTAANGCQITENFVLVGPGGCDVCPSIGTLTSNPASATCTGTTVGLTASGLTSMGNTYGIEFKYSTSPLADPYTSGTSIAIVGNGSLTNSGTEAATSTSFATAGTYYIYAILSPAPIDPACRPNKTVTLVVNATPTVDPVANQVICNNGNTTAVSFSGAVVGTSFNWTNNNTSIGLAASGTGDIASFTAINTGTVPVTATVTVTPVTVNPGSPVSETFTSTGAVQTWTVPAGVTQISINAKGAQGGSNAMGVPGGLGGEAGGILTVTPGQVLNIYVGNSSGYNGGGAAGNVGCPQAFGGIGGGASDIRIGGTALTDRVIVAGGGGGAGGDRIGGCGRGTGGGGGGGYYGGGGGAAWPSTSVILPTGGTQAGGGIGGLSDYLLAPNNNGLPGVLGDGGKGGDEVNSNQAGTNTGITGGTGGGLTGADGQYAGNFTGQSGAGGSSYIGGVTSGVTSSGTNSGNGSVVITYTLLNGATCTGTPTTFTYTVNPTPTVNAVTNQAVCNGSATPAINFSGAVAGTVYNWTNSNTSIGLGASGTGDIGSFTAINTGSTPVTATITVTPSYTNAGTTCTGTPVTFTITVSPTPTVDPVANQVICNNGSTLPVSFSGALAGTTFNWTNSNTSIGLPASGTGNIASFIATNAGNTPVTATVTVTPVSPASGGVTTQNFSYTGAVQTWTVPAGVTSITIDAYGAEGGSGAAGGGAGNLGGAGGKGTKATGTLAVTPGQVLNIYVGGAGGQATGGYNGGGTGGNALSGGGGGASDVRYPGTAASDRIIVAAGGGGGGRGGCETNNAINGGAGGNGDADGVNGTSSPDGGGGFGGTLASGGGAGIGCGGFLGQPGAAGTVAGVGGDGGAGQSCCCFSNGSLPGGGGGGGGYVGGGSGGGGSAGTTGCSGNNKGGGGGGAGGTSYTGGVTSGALTFATQSGNGLVTITYNIPVGTSCSGTPTTFTYTVNPTPTVNAVSNQAVCNGAATAAVNFSGAVAGTVYSWTNNNTSIGLGASGTGDIGSFTAINTGTTPVVATITVTPSYTNAGTTCTGTPVTFTITVNPTPNAVATPAAQTLCSNTPITTIALTGNVTGTTYTWTRNNTVNVTGIAASGSGNISGTMVNNTGVQQVVTFTITPSANGCAGTPITATVTLNVAPVITCPANITVNNTPGQCGAIVNYPPATATGSPTPVITYSQASGTFFPVGTTIVTATATNACGTNTCTFTVTVVDAQAPTIVCPANITVNNTAGICGANVTYPFPTVGDNCALPGGTPVSLSQTTNNTTIVPIQIGCQAGGLTTENSWWRAYNLAPLNLPAGLSIKNVNFGIEKITGGPVPITARIWISNGAFPASTRTLAGQATATFAVQANTFGTISFPSAILVPANAIVAIELNCPDQRANGRSFFIGSNDLGESAPSYLSAAACGITNPTEIANLVAVTDHIILNMNAEYYTSAPTLVQIAGLASGSVFPVGTTTNTFRATDAAGNTSTCSFTVTVNDAQAPVISCPANIVRNTDAGVCTASVAVPNPTFSDNCAVTQLTWTMTGATVASSPATGINFVGTRTFNLNGTTGSGVTTITYTARDAAGNTTTCSFTVTINDAVRPVISGQPATRFTCAGSNAVFSVAATTNGGPLAYQWQEWNGSAWVNIAGATSSSVTVNNVSFTDNTRPFRVILTGLCTVVISDAAILYVNPLPTVTLTTSIPPILSPAQSLNINAVANPPGGNYVWSFNGTVVPGRTGSSWNGVTVDGIGTYRVTYTDPNGCTSASADLVIAGQPSDGLWVYPNPNNGQFMVRYYNQLNENITINVYDAKGARVFQKLAVGGTAYTLVEVSLGNQFAAGVYVVQVVNGAGKVVGYKQIIVRHR